MNEIKHIHLGRQSFTISVEAYKELHEYLAAIKTQVGTKGSDVVDEVEMRMAELLAEHGISGEKVVLSADVQFLKDQLGEPHDFKDEDDDTAGNDAEKQVSSDGAPRRFFRDTDRAMFAGVASGLAAFFGIDVTVVRLIFVVLTFFGGSGVLIYILLWLIVPEARTNSERLQMRGKAVTVDSLKEVVDRAHIAEAAERAGKVGQEIGRGAGRGIAKVVEGVAKAVLAVIGVGLMIVAAALFVGTTVTGTYTLIHGETMGGQIVFPLGSEAVAGVVCAIIVLYSLAFLMMLGGLTMVRRKAVIRGWVVGAVLGVFLIAGGLGTAFGFDIAPQIRDKYRSLHHTQTVSVPAFTNVDLTGKDVNYTFAPSAKYSVDVQYFGDANTVSAIKPRVKDNTLTVDTSNYEADSDSCTIFCLYSDDWLTVTIHAPSLQAAKIRGNNTNLSLSGSDLTPASFTLTVGTNDQATLNDVRSTTTSMDVGRADGMQQITLQGITAWQNDFVRVADGIVNMQGPGAVTVNANDSSCGSAALIYLSNAPDSLTVNGKNVNPSTLATQSGQWAETDSNATNCVLIE